MSQIPYKSFCWSLGTTSFRTKNFNKTIEEQLKLLRSFWSLPENDGVEWRSNPELQAKYYDYMRASGFVEGDAANKPKDAREKTSGLVDIGIIDEGRRITGAGLALLKICDEDDFADDNLFQIDKDSFLYLKQLLKVSNDVDGNTVRPFLVLLHMLFELDHLSLDEFTYLLPLCIDEETTSFVVSEIKSYREGKKRIDDIILDRLFRMENYKEAHSLFLESEPSEELMMAIGLNRKSREYDRSYYHLYCVLKNVYLYGDRGSAFEVYQATKEIKIGGYWREYIFDSANSASIKKDPAAHIRGTWFDDVSDESSFKETFFKVMHLLKAKATLTDYKDLNRRYIKTADLVLFVDDEVKLDILPRAAFSTVIGSLYLHAFTPCSLLFEDVSLTDIDPCLAFNETKVVGLISEMLGTPISSLQEAKTRLEDVRYKRFQHLLDTKFTKASLLNLLSLFEERKDIEIQQLVTDNADVPTIFEYILGIIWYNVSERSGRILDYMKLSLDADLLPKTHASGGEADIVYAYPKTTDYGAHSVLLEATLADNVNQRRMEMEPVSRHLGQHLLKTGNLDSFCVFLTTFLHINVLSDFRVRKEYFYYDATNPDKYIVGMKIIPLETSELKTIVKKDITYKELYPLFEKAYRSSLPPREWYENEIKARL